MRRRQFIAGAVCPECQQMDRIVIEESAGKTQRRCVACGFLDDAMPAAGVVPATRFSRPSTRHAGDPDGEPAKVRIIDRQTRQDDSGKPRN